MPGGGWASVLPKKQGSLPTRPRQTHGFRELQHPRDETRENRTLQHLSNLHLAPVLWPVKGKLMTMVTVSR